MRPDSVSVIIPAYNCARFIDETLESCFRQTVKPYEIIVVDDGSTDGTGGKLKAYADCGLIRCASQKHGERCAARNRGLEMAEGRLIQFLDADDLLHPEKLERQIEYLHRNPDFDGVYSSTVYFRDTPERKVGTLTLAYHGDILGPLLARNFIPINAMLFCKSPARFDVSLNALEDWDYWLQLCSAGYRIGHMPAFLNCIRVHGNNSSRSLKRTLRAELRVLEKYSGMRRYRPIISFRRISLEVLLHERGVLNGLWRTLIMPRTAAARRIVNVSRFLKLSIMRNRRNVYRRAGRPPCSTTGTVRHGTTTEGGAR